MVTGYNEGNYIRQTSDVNDQYGRNSATNAYSRFLSQQRGSRQLGDMGRAFGRQYPGQKADLGRRGLSGPGVSSGIQQEQMGRFIGDYVRDYGRTQQDVTQQLQQFDLNQQHLDQWRQATLNDIEAQKRNDIANAATNLQWLQNYTGGI